MKLRPSRRDLITGAAALAAYSRIGDVRAQTARRVLLEGGVPSWVLPGASIDLNFATGQYYGATLSSINLSRASSATNLLFSSASGFAYTSFSSNTPVITPGLGFQIFSNSTNIFLNSATPATQSSINLSATGTYQLWVNGSGSATIAAGTATITGAGTATQGSPVAINCTATGTVSVTISGSLNAVQLEQQTFPTPFVPTAGASATRASDVPTAIGPLLTALRLSSASVVAQVTTPNSSVTGRVVNFDTGPSPLYISANNQAAQYNGSGTITAATAGSLFSTGTKVGASWNNATPTRSLVMGNGTVSTNASVIDLSGTPTNIWIGTFGGVGNWIEGYIGRLTVFPTQISNAALQGFTK